MTTQAPPAQQIAAQATSSSTGTATFNFPMAPQGSVISGTVSIPTAPILTLTSATLSGLVIGQWRGNNPWGPVEANPTQILSLSSTGLAPNTMYTAVWMAQTVPVASAPGNTPAALLTTEVVAVQSFSQLLGSQTNGGTAMDFGGIPDFTESLLISSDPAAGTVTYSVTGDQTGTEYYASYGTAVTSSIVGFSVVVPIVGLLDSSVTITPNLNPSVLAVTVTVYALSTTPNLPLPAPQAYTLEVTGAGDSAFGPNYVAALLWSFELSAYSTAGAANAQVILFPVDGTGGAQRVFALTPAMANMINVDFAGEQLIQAALTPEQPAWRGAADWQQDGVLVMTILGT